MNKIVLVLALLGTVILLSLGCTTTHYVAPTCPTMEAPPDLNNLSWVKIIITDPDTGKSVSYYAIPASEAIKEKINVERVLEYADRCYQLNK